MPEQLLTQLTSGDFVAIGLGIVLLVAGRKLFWLALGGLGFLFGLWLASHVLGFSSGAVELVVGLVAGLCCAFLAVVAQKIAVAIGGFLLGGAGALWIASFFESSLQGRSELWLLLIAAVGAILGATLAPSLFEASLAVSTSFVGALLVVSRSHIGLPHETWVFVALLVVGLLIQMTGREGQRAAQPRRREQNESRARA